MKSAGDLIKEARIKKKWSRIYLEAQSKIKLEFIDAIERSSWDKLPEFPTVAGFVKSLCSLLELDTEKCMALLRRDFPQKSLNINPKPDVIKRFILTPQKVLWGLSFTAVVLITLYLAHQLYLFNTPPFINIGVPEEGEVVLTDEIIISGSVKEGSSLTVNNQPVLIDSGGYFSTKLPVNTQTRSIEFRVKSRSGKETVVIRNIVVKEPEN